MCRSCGRRHNSLARNPTSNGPQDVSIEPAGSIPFSFGLWSPGKTSPLRGRNMKEYEEQLEHFKKENFALKLRIYFLEEKVSHKVIKEDKEELHKNNIELKVETESLKKELSEKQELVRQAAALLTSLENQFKEQLEVAARRHDRETDDLKATIAHLQKNMDEYSERLRLEGPGGDLTRLCGLAFSNVDPKDSTEFEFAESSKGPTECVSISSKLQGVFSLPEGLGSPTLSPECQKDMIPSRAHGRIQELEDEVERLTTKVQDLEDSLQDKERMSLALEEDIVNLKKEIEDREEKMYDLEQEVTEKDQKVDQLMQDLETRHLEIEAKDSTIQTLHEDLSEVEPQIEVKVQEIMEKDKIIEEKTEQLQQQNKILVEIQITLDEKKKQIAELEDSLLNATQKGEKLDKDFSVSLTTIQNMAQDVMIRDKEILALKKELKKKEKKVKDLLAELKEALDMLKKAKWEAETSGGQDSVKEMVEEENERLWAELEQRKIELINLHSQKDSLLKTVAETEEAMKKLKEEWEEKMRTTEKVEQNISIRDKAHLDPELATLKEKLESRECLLRTQEVVMNGLKSDLAKAREELLEKKEELIELKKELSEKNLDMKDFITKELLGRNKEVKGLQDKLGNLLRQQDNPLEMIKFILQNNPLRIDLEGSPAKFPEQQIQANSSSPSKLDVDHVNAEPKNKEPSPPLSSRSNSFSLLENALCAHMGQKVCNTNQTFNTYVLPGDTSAEKKTTETPNQLIPVILAEGLKGEINTKEDSSAANFLNKDHNSGSLPVETTHSQGKSELQTESKPSSHKENTLQLLYHEMSSIREEAQALRKDREILNQKVSALQMLNEPVGESDPLNKQDPNRTSYKEEVTDNKEGILAKETATQNSTSSEFKAQIENLNSELKGIKNIVTLKMLQMASSKYQGSLKNYKQEIISLRKRLADSHNACDLLRTRLEELVDFMEHILDMDRKGIINLSHLSSSQRALLKKSLDDSRSLSHSLSHSLMIGSDSLLGDSLSTVSDEEASRFCLPLENLPLEVEFSHLENTNASDGGANITESSVLDSSFNDMMYHSFAAKVVSYLESKTQEIDRIFSKFNHLSTVLKTKDEQLKVQMETLVNLRNQNVKLEKQLKTKDRHLAETNGDHSSQISDSKITTINSASKSTLPSDPNESNHSLHLSNLQHTLASPALDPRVYGKIFTTPVESSSSETLPPPSGEQQNKKDESAYNKPIKKPLSLIDDCSKQFNRCQIDIGTPYSTDFAIKSLSKLNEAAFSSKTAGELSEQSRAHRMSLEQLTLPPSFALGSPSESEAWSEPDRNVSLARIGLETCNLISTGHDRSLSRSRMTRSAPFTSESDGEGVPEEGSTGVGTPSSKTKRRPEAAEVKRLTTKLKSMEQLNETLRAELRIYQTLDRHLNGVARKGGVIPTSDHSRKLSFESKSENNLDESEDILPGHATPVDDSSVVIPSSLLQEIRSLRMKLEEAIINNDLLRDQLEAALSGYLTEESRHLIAKLATAQQKLTVNQEKLLLAATTEEQLRFRVKENESKVLELGEQLASHETCNQKLEKKINDLNVELQGSKQNILNAEEQLRATKEEKECTEKSREDSKTFRLEMDISSLQRKSKAMFEAEKEKESKMKEQSLYIKGLEEAKVDYESKLKEQDSAITELCQSITKLQQDNSQSSISDEIISKLQDALQNSEGRLLQVTKERFALVGEKARLQAKLSSVTTHAKLLQKEMREASVSDENSSTDSEAKKVQPLQRLKTAQTKIHEVQQENEQFKSEKQAMQKEMELLQEEISALRSHLDHILSREAVKSSREVRELASVRVSYENLKEKHTTLETKYEALVSEKSALEEKVKIIGKKEDIEDLKRALEESESQNERVVSQLEAEKCLNENLQTRIKHLQSHPSYHNVPLESQSCGSPSALIRPREESSPLKIRGEGSPLKGSSTHSWTEDKENRMPRTSHSKESPFFFLNDDDITSGESPDLGICSDGQFSSLERLGGIRVPVTGMNYRASMYEGRQTGLCSEPSHSQLLFDLEQIRQEREELRGKLNSSKANLKDALQQLSKANQKKESVERAIYRQLTKTHDVLKRAKGNLRQAKGRNETPQTAVDPNQSSKETS